MSDSRQSMSVMVALFGAVLVVVGLRRLRSGIAVYRRAVRCRGVVTDLRIRRHRRTRGRSGYTTYHPVLAFRTSDGEDVQTEARLGKSWDGYRPGQAVTITYDPRDPSHAYAGRGAVAVVLPLVDIASGVVCILIGSGVVDPYQLLAPLLGSA